MWRQLACALFFLTAATGSFFEAGCFFAAIFLFVAKHAPRP